MKHESLFIFKGEINPLCLLLAQRPLGGTIISFMRCYKGTYYMQIDHNSEAQIDGYIERISEYVNVEKQNPLNKKDIYYVTEKV